MNSADLQRARRASAQRGFSLIELMVAAIIGIVILGVVASLYIANRKVFQFQESYSRLQEAGRYTMDALGSDMRAASYAGCGPLAEATNLSNLLNPSLHEEIRNIIAKDGSGNPYWWLDTARMVWGYDDNGGAIPAELNATVSDSDVLVVKYRSSAGEIMITDHDLANRRFAVAANSYPKGTTLVASDCAHASAFRMSNVSSGSPALIEYNTGSLPAALDNTGDQLSPEKYAVGGFISPLIVNAYYVMASNSPALVDTPDPCPTTDAAFIRRVLVVRTLSGSTDGNLLPPRPVACDVQTLQVRFGVDNDGDVSADRFMRADEIGVNNQALWRRVVSVRVELLVVNPKLNTAESDVVQCLDYNGGGTPQTCPNAADATAGAGYGYRWAGQGRRSAKVFTSTYSLRNRAS
ncbi:PilW family protein [Rhodocyclus tenuis]|nr:PilW family protein [Rhodocyclus tenuis]